jgi:hypothetical protein
MIDRRKITRGTEDRRKEESGRYALEAFVMTFDSKKALIFWLGAMVKHGAICGSTAGRLLVYRENKGGLL